jgi:hypothetical protein
LNDVETFRILGKKSYKLVGITESISKPYIVVASR